MIMNVYWKDILSPWCGSSVFALFPEHDLDSSLSSLLGI